MGKVFEQKTGFNRLVGVIALIVLFRINGAQAQTIPGEVTVSGSYGIASLFFTPDLVNTTSTGNDTTIGGDYSSRTITLQTDLKIKPILLKGEVQLTDHTSLGLLIMYNGFVASGVREDSTYFASTNTYTREESSLKYTLNRWRIQISHSWHFQHDNPQWDTYFSCALGANIKRQNYYVNGVRSSMDDLGIFSILPAFPLSMRLTYGARYYLSQRFALQSEVSLGGPFLTIGFASRF